MISIASLPVRLPRPLRRGLLIFACVVGGLMAAAAQLRATSIDGLRTFTSESDFLAAAASAGLSHGTMSFAAINFPEAGVVTNPQAAVTFTQGANSLSAQTDGGLMSVAPIGLTSSSAGTGTPVAGTSYVFGFTGHSMNLTDFSFSSLDLVYGFGGRFSLSDFAFDPLEGVLRFRLFSAGGAEAASFSFGITSDLAGFSDVLAPGVFLGILAPVAFERVSVDAVVSPGLNLGLMDFPWVGVGSVVLAGDSTSSGASAPAGSSSVPDHSSLFAMLGSALFGLAGAASRWRRRK